MGAYTEQSNPSHSASQLQSLVELHTPIYVMDLLRGYEHYHRLYICEQILLEKTGRIEH